MMVCTDSAMGHSMKKRLDHIRVQIPQQCGGHAKMRGGPRPDKAVRAREHELQVGALRQRVGKPPAAETAVVGAADGYVSLLREVVS